MEHKKKPTKSILLNATSAWGNLSFNQLIKEFEGFKQDITLLETSFILLKSVIYNNISPNTKCEYYFSQFQHINDFTVASIFVFKGPE